MARRQSTDSTQLAFTIDELNNKLNEEPDKLQKLEIKPEDIGGELLAILSKGLYTNPLDCIREYIQNSVDAKATSVIIKITGNSVTIIDEGSGMSLAELVQARQFGLSGKSIGKDVGFRGIGIYSGFDLCNRLRISTKKADENHINILVFDFEAMRSRLEADKNLKRGEQKTSLFDLLTEYTQIGRENFPSEADNSRHFTQVRLEDISAVHIRELSNRERMRTYLLQNLPIDFADSFDYKDEINQLLASHVYGDGYTPVKITLESDGQPDDMVVKDAIPNLQPPKYGYISTSSGVHIAFYWACQNTIRQRIGDNFPGLKDTVKKNEYEGFVYKVKGFTIGDRQNLRLLFKRKPQLYSWYSGEIYVLDSNIIPNAERNDFEENQAKRALTFAVSNELSKLEKEVEDFRDRGVAHERIEKYTTEVRDINISNLANVQDNEAAFEAYSRLNTIIDDLAKQKNHADLENKKIAVDLVTQAKALQQQLRKEADSPTPEEAKKKRAAKSDKVTNRKAVPDFEPPPAPEIKTLRMILREIGWEVEGDLALLVDAVQGSLEDVLGTSVSYRSLITDIEARLTSNSVDE